MKIDSKRLNLIIPIDRPDGSKVYVHSAPISREVFEAYYEVLAATYSSMYAGSVDMISASRIAFLTLKKIATQRGVWEVSESGQGVKGGLLPEIHRLTVVLAPTDNGWSPIPYNVAISQGVLDDDDEFEVSNAIIFFTCASWMLRKNIRGEILHGAVRMWGAEVSLSNPSEYSNSLPKLTETVNSGETAEVLSQTS